MEQQSSDMHKIINDPTFRSFLSVNFDDKAFIKQIVSENRVEDSLSEISRNITLIDDEIKQYITANKDSLMGGMSNIAILTEKYNTLSETSETLSSNIEKLSKEVVSSYSYIQDRTTELENIHARGLALRYVRQFIHCRAQLQHHLSLTESTNSKDGKKTALPPSSSSSKPAVDNYSTLNLDIRHLATAAKILFELETLLSLPLLSNIKLVIENSSNIRRFGSQLRQKAQEQLLQSLKDCNRSLVGSSLQIFYNLNSLPEILIYAIDNTVRRAIELSNAALDFEGLVSSYSILSTKNSANPGGLGGDSGRNQQARVAGSNLANVISAEATSPQMRMSMKEVAHLWSTQILENAMQIHILQWVILNKEDPSTHKRFISLLSQIISAPGANNSNKLLSSGKLIDLFWSRLAVALDDFMSTKIKSYPIAVVRMFPILRKGLNDAVLSLASLASKDHAKESMNSLSYGSGIMTDGDYSSSAIFGSIAFPPTEIAGLSGGRRLLRSKAATSGLQSSSVDATADSSLSSDGVLSGLRPCRDRYLVYSLSRMTAPVQQMFPEVDGYTAAVPSKRDLQTFIKAITSELLMCAVESDAGLIRSVGKECLKTVQLFLTKVEGLSITSNETRKILLSSSSGSNSNSGKDADMFTKNSGQEHNALLTVLLFQLKESLAKLPDAVIATSSSTAGSVLAPSSDGSSDSASVASGMRTEMTMFVTAASSAIEDVLSKHFLSPLVETLAYYIKHSILVGMTKEGLIISPNTVSSGTKAVGSATVESSVAAQNLSKQLPALIQTYLLSLAIATSKNSSSSVSTAASNATTGGRLKSVSVYTEELCLRVMQSYVTIAVLARPINEHTKLRCSCDMTIIESTIQPFFNTKDAAASACPVICEFNALKRLIFFDSADSNAGGLASDSAPSLSQLNAFPLFNKLRPSTLLGYLSCGAPAVMPLPYESLSVALKSSALNKNTLLVDMASADPLAAYVELLTTPLGVVDSSASSDSPPNASSNSVRSFYYSTERGYQSSPVEIAVWSSVKVSLDVFLVRLNSGGARGSDGKNWYKLLVDVGDNYFNQSPRTFAK